MPYQRLLLGICQDHDFSDGHAARHRNMNIADPAVFVRSVVIRLSVPFLACPVHQTLRQRWFQHQNVCSTRL